MHPLAVDGEDDGLIIRNTEDPPFTKPAVVYPEKLANVGCPTAPLFE